ncbi:hypothetical protein ETAE_1157 [Edwardsiella piscicida]|uniref:Uncharacterized protein n=1 Tax=Edwardsiella piscicida TaxID=1263550 RepID=A0AAU8P2D4_EDWPI|nr:hypothetical protein ETAE_1157 [Edwardsiella tarda EIB202]
MTSSRTAIKNNRLLFLSLLQDLSCGFYSFYVCIQRYLPQS